MTLYELELELRSALTAHADPAFEARAILQALTDQSTAGLLLGHDKVAEPAVIERARQWAQRRAEGYPLAYLSGKKGFYKYDFNIAPGVLVPRPESEHVIEVALARAPDAKRFADLGCGSGCIGLSLLGELPAAELFAVDVSPEAIRVTLENLKALGLSGRAKVFAIEVELFQPPGPLDLVIANPPYIAEADPDVQDSVHRYEPHTALYSGPDGLSAIRTWAEWSSRNLRPLGTVVFEIGSRQSRSVQEIMGAVDFTEIQITKDLAGHERVISAVKRS